MDKQQEGIVIELIGEMAKVKTSRHNDCENCGACPGNSFVLEVRNSIGAKIGQHVIVEVQEIGMLKAAFIVYVLPLLAIFAGAVGGYYLAEYLYQTALWFEVSGGLIAFIFSVLYIKYFDSSARTDAKMQPVIVKIIS
jgi:sigma-E factor negative regulatory protein RseC